MHRDRGRLTLPDFLLLFFSLAVFGALFPPFFDIFSQNAGVMSVGTNFIFQMVLPLLLLVVLAAIYRTSIRGLP